jgi:hypothetical protein
MKLPNRLRTRKVSQRRGGGKSGIEKIFNEEVLDAAVEGIIEAVIEGGAYRKRPKHKASKSTTGKNGKGYKGKSRTRRRR